MDAFQRQAFEMAVAGHNMIITGQAGTGKTFVVREIAKKMKNVSVVCSTGIAARQYTDLDCSTLHMWSGIQDGRYLNEEIVHLVNTDEKFYKSKCNIEKCETLIIDEVSMISSKTLSQVEVLCRQVRNSPSYFGDIQVILVGDYYQLPPVSNELYGDPGRHCFLSFFVENMFPHKIQLTNVHRQVNPELINCINELEEGFPSEETCAFLGSLDRPLEHESVHLFARNFDVDLYNYNKLQELPGETKVYTSTDVGSSHYLNKFMAPKKLGLKLKSPVMLLKNLSDQLVNGLCGEVTTLHDNSVDITFQVPNKTLTVSIEPVSFTTYDPITKTVLAQRIQLPLKLGYAFTIHKAQGMTLPYVTVHCENIVQPGQLGVAVGRAVAVEGLKVEKFRKNLCKKHPDHVYTFYKSFTIGEVSEDLTCCRNKKTTATDDEDTHKQYDSDNDNNSDFSDHQIELIESLETLPETTESVLSMQALDSIMLEFTDTPAEEEAKSFQSSVQRSPKHYAEWFEKQFSLIEEIGLSCFPEEETSFTNKHQNEFFMKFNQYINSDQFESSVQHLLKVYKTDQQGPAFRVLNAILFYLEQRFIENVGLRLHLKPAEPLPKPAAESDLDSVARGKIRYVGGYVIATLKYNLSKKIRSLLYVKGKENELKTNQSKMLILNSLCGSYEDVMMSTTDSESLEETKRKQNIRESLINVNDDCFRFFKCLELGCREQLTHEQLATVGKTLFDKVKECLLSDKHLFENFLQCMITSRQPVTVETDDVREILTEVVSECDAYQELFESVVDLFLKTSLSQFRRDYLQFLKQEKGKSLRKKVMESSKKKGFNVKFFEEDKSPNKESSYLRLKSELLQNKNILEESSFTMKNLLMLCESFGVKVPGKKNKKTVIKLIVEKILPVGSESPQPGISASIAETPLAHSETAAAGEPSSETAAAGEPSSYLQPVAVTQRKTSAKQRKVTKKGKGKRRKLAEKETDDKCGICYKSYIEEEDWISCDTCSLWFHRACVSIVNEEEWARYSEEGEPFCCPLCL